MTQPATKAAPRSLADCLTWLFYQFKPERCVTRAIQERYVTNAVAIGLALLIGASLVVDQVLFDGETTLFLGRKFLDLLTWLAFWR